MSHNANVTICSPFRDAAGQLPAYLDRIWALHHDPEHLRFIAVEGDSVDDTWARLQEWRASDERLHLLKCDCHQPHFGSVVDPTRFMVLAKVFNTALDAVNLAWSDYVLFLPCDIEYDADLLVRLLDCQLDIIAPFSYQDGYFYDVWAFRLHDRCFDKFTELDAFHRFGTAPVPLDTVGGTVLLARGVLASGCRYTLDEVDRGLCRMAREQGFSVYGHPGIKVYHGGRHGG